jgi:hypothetical protein
MTPKLKQKHKIIIGVQTISATALILFWAGYFLVLQFGFQPPSFFSDYPGAIPFPDALLLIMMLTSAFYISKQRKYGFILAGLTAVVLIYLGIVGFKIQLQDGLLLISMVTMLKSGFVNLWCIVFGLYFLLKMKKEKEKEK